MPNAFDQFGFYKRLERGVFRRDGLVAQAERFPQRSHRMAQSTGQNSSLIDDVTDVSILQNIHGRSGNRIEMSSLMVPVKAK